MSIDRYLAIVHPLSSIRYRTIKNAWVVCILTWCVCIVIMTPYWMYARTASQRDGTASCRMFWPHSNNLAYEWFWTNFQLIIGFVLPILIMVFCYVYLLRHLIVENVPSQDVTKRPIRKVTVMLFIVTMVFITCWTPYHIMRYVFAVCSCNLITNPLGNPCRDFLSPYHIIHMSSGLLKLGSS